MTNIQKSDQIVCNHPGCARVIAAHKPQGVCWRHLHKTGCGCDRCTDRAAWDAKQRAKGIAQVEINAAPSTSWGGSAQMLVSLPLAPWERVG